MEAELQRVDALLSLQGEDLRQALQAGDCQMRPGGNWMLQEGKQQGFGDPKATTYLVI